MPTIFRTGGGGVPQWNVYTGLTAPPVKENGLWVALDINIHNVNLVFGTSRPENPADKTLYIAYTSKDNMPLAKPLRNVDEISYHIVSAVWYTTAGGWTGVDLYVVKDGAWALHNKGEYYLYVKSGAHAVSKITEAGEIVWMAELTSPYSSDASGITDIAVDNINGCAYVLQSTYDYKSGIDKHEYKITKLALSSGDAIAKFPSGSSWSSSGSNVRYMGRVFLTPNRESIVATSAIAGYDNSKGAIKKFDANLTEIQYQSNNDSYVGIWPAMRDNGKLRSATNGSSTYDISELDIDTWSVNVIKSNSISSNSPVCCTLTTGEMIFGSESSSSNIYEYLNDGTVVANSWPELLGIESATVGCKAVLELIDGSLVVAINGSKFKGFWFASINKNTGELTEAKRIAFDANIYNMVVTPAGTIYCASNSTVYRINDDDTITAIANTMNSATFVYERSFLACDPCDRLTFPEYFS